MNNLWNIEIPVQYDLYVQGDKSMKTANQLGEKAIYRIILQTRRLCFSLDTSW